MANIRAHEILPSPHAGRWQQSWWAYHLIAGRCLWAGTPYNVSACRDHALLEGRRRGGIHNASEIVSKQHSTMAR